MTSAAARRVAATVASAEAGRRLDLWLAERLPDLSRTRIKALVDAGRIRVDDAPALKASRRLRSGERVEAEIPSPPPEEMVPEAIPLAIVFEDDEVLVVDKPAGIVTHPGAGARTGTLAAAALAHAPGIAGVGGPRRPGIVHRLDKGTSGLIALAKTSRAYDSLTAQLQRRTVSRRYLCLAHGANEKMIGKDVIELRDNDGKFFVKERVEMMSKGPEAKGWQDYKFMNPVSRQIEPKSMYLQRYEDLIVGCGIYKS